MAESTSESDTWWRRIKADVEEFTRFIPSLDPVRLQLTVLTFANGKVHLLRPCTVAKGSQDCWLLDSLSEVNGHLAPACLEIEETLSTKTALRSYSRDDKAYSGLLVACFLAYFLLRRHACIQVLDIQLNQLPMFADHALELALGHSRCLEEVTFNWWFQERTGKSRLLENLPELSSLWKLSLCPLSAKSEAAAEAISRNRGIRELEVGGESLNHKGLRKILGAVGGCHQLTSLELKNVLVSPMNAKRLCHLLESPSSFLTKLLLYYVTGVLVDGVLESLQSNTTLEELSLLRVRERGTYSFSHISALKTNRALKTLLVQECSIDVSEFADMLRINSALEVLALTICQLSDADAIILAEAIKVNRTLQKLNVQDNGLSADSVAVFARCLARNSCLQVIDMGYIYFAPDRNGSFAGILCETKACGRLLVSWSEAGLLELASALSDPQVSMRKLFLDWRKDMEVSAAIVGILTALSVNMTVTELTIESGRAIDNAIGEQLALTLRSNTSLKHVSIQNCLGRHDLMVVLLEALEDNCSVSTLCFYDSIKSGQDAMALCKMLAANSTIYSVEFGGWRPKGKSLVALAAAISCNGILLRLKLRMACTHKHFARVRESLRRNLIVVKRAVRFVTQHSEDKESECAFRKLNGKESLLQTLIKVTRKTETEVKAVIDAAAQRTL